MKNVRGKNSQAIPGLKLCRLQTYKLIRQKVTGKERERERERARERKRNRERESSSTFMQRGKKNQRSTTE